MTTETQDRTYADAAMARLGEAAAALYRGLINGGVPEPTAAWMVALWLTK